MAKKMIEETPGHDFSHLHNDVEPIAHDRKHDACSGHKAHVCKGKGSIQTEGGENETTGNMGGEESEY